ncbi:SpoIIE family protein phosphatase [Streptomyces sp. NPDC048297]|uniref:SpoIIE family protein phosphatase n=1 Tax=Streptomyces sp. NPDC048297 TaxID=3365531 RepID=UPI0037122479
MERQSTYTATATIDEQGILTGWSEGAQRLLGYEPSAVVGRPATGLLAAESEAAWRELAGQQRWNGTVPLRHRDGRRLDLGLLAHRRTSGTGPSDWLVVTAVPARPRPPEGVPLEEWAFLQSPFPLGIFDTDLRLMRANRRLERALSLPEAAIRGLRLTHIVPGAAGEEADRAMRRVLETGRPQEVPALLGADADADTGGPTVLTPLKDADGHVRAVCLATHQHAAQGPAPVQRPEPHLAAEPHLSAEPPASAEPHRTRRYSRTRGTNLSLRRSLLPHPLPDQDALELAARYLPAATRAGVGGDWFDVIPLSGARVALVVGDVVGHGIHASATMGRLRTAVRTLADVDLPADELLTHLDDLVLRLAADEGVADPAGESAGGIGTTCLYAVYDPVTRRCTAARAGAPPPAVVTPDGAARFLDVPAGPPLGLGGLPFEALETELPEGSLLALYTDGLLEARDHDIDEELDKLFAALARPAPTLDAVCDQVLDDLLDHRPEDDIALLVARTRALHPGRVATWELDSAPSVVGRARQHADEQLSAWGLDEAAFSTELIVSELVTNAIRYGRPPIRLRLIHQDSTLICEVYDSSGSTPHMRRARMFDEGGRGLLLVAQLTARWGTRHDRIGKTVWAEQRVG